MINHWVFRFRQRRGGRKGSNVAHGGQPVGHAAPGGVESQPDLGKVAQTLLTKSGLTIFLQQSLKHYLN